MQINNDSAITKDILQYPKDAPPDRHKAEIPNRNSEKSTGFNTSRTIPKLVLALLKNLFFSSTERTGVSRMNSSDVSSSSK